METDRPTDRQTFRQTVRCAKERAEQRNLRYTHPLTDGRNKDR
jgi:hypothetical protein